MDGGQPVTRAMETEAFIRGKLLAVDPGLDRLGWALFSVNGTPRSFESALATVCEVGVVRTRPGAPMAERLLWLGRQVRRVVSGPPGEMFAVIESPTTATAYASRRARGGAAVNARSLSGFNQAVGAVTFALADALVNGVHQRLAVALAPPPQLKKALRRRAVEAVVVSRLGLDRGLLEDECDAVYLGASWLARRVK